MPNHHHHAPAGGCYSLSPLPPPLTTGRARRRWRGGGNARCRTRMSRRQTDKWKGKREKKSKKEKRTSATGDVFFLPLSTSRRRCLRRQSGRETRQCTYTRTRALLRGPAALSAGPTARRTWNASRRGRRPVGRPVFAMCPPAAATRGVILTNCARVINPRRARPVVGGGQSRRTGLFFFYPAAPRRPEKYNRATAVRPR